MLLNKKTKHSTSNIKEIQKRVGKLDTHKHLWEDCEKWRRISHTMNHPGGNVVVVVVDNDDDNGLVPIDIIVSLGDKMCH